MIKYVYASKNVKSGNFNMPMLYDIPSDNAAEMFEISMKESKKEAVEALKELDIYFLGTFDTKTGCFGAIAPEFLLSGAAVLGDTNGN